MDFNKLYVFVRIAEVGSISRAALALKLPKSQISRKLNLLEQELGQQLVYRTTRHFELTSVGRTLFEQARQAYQALEDSLHTTGHHDRELRGTLRITAPEDVGVYLLNPIIEEFRSLHPKVKIEAIYTHETLNLISESIDVALRVGKLSDSSLRRRHAGYIELILVTSPEYLKKHTLPTTPEDLNHLDTLAFLTKKRSPVWTLQNDSKVTNLKIHPSILVNNYPALGDFVVRGFGVGLLPSFLCQKWLRSGELIHILKDWKSQEVPLQLVSPPTKSKSAPAKAFTEFCVLKLKLN